MPTITPLHDPLAHHDGDTVIAGEGTALLPSYTFEGDLDTGMWHPVSDELAWSVGGAEYARLTDAAFTVKGTAGLVVTSNVPIGLDMSSGTFATAAINAGSGDIITTGLITGATFNATDEDNVLQIDGTTVLRTGAAANYNMFLGEGAFDNDEGIFNIGIGFKAGYYNDASGSGGYSNIYIGSNAGYGNAGGNTGNNNVAIGVSTLSKNTTGHRNFALGAWALKNNTTGVYNFAFGPSAMESNISGSRNIAIGREALKFAVGPVGTVAIGEKAMRAGATPTYDVGIGFQSLFNTTGEYNVGIGANAGRGNTSGNSNIFVGYKSGYNQTTNSNLLIIDNQDRGSAAAEITDTLIYGVFNATPASQSLRFNVGNLIQGNPVHSDADGGGAMVHSWIREDGAGTPTTAATLIVSHDGSGANDQLAKMILGVNTGAGVVDVIKIDSNAATFIGDAGVTNYSQFEADGTYVMNGAATVFEDIIISLSAAKVPAANAPTWSTFIGNLKAYTYDLNDSQEFSTELSHAYKEGAVIEFHIHGAVNGLDGDDRTIKFEVEYSIVDVPAESGFGDVYSTPTTISSEITIPASTTGLTSFSIDIGDDTSGAFGVGAIVKGRVRRIASSGTEPAANPFVTEVGIHIENDTIGSRTVTAK